MQVQVQTVFPAEWDEANNRSQVVRVEAMGGPTQFRYQAYAAGRTWRDHVVTAYRWYNPETGIRGEDVWDDLNTGDGDGCAADCRSVEQDFACQIPGEACVSTVKCGNGVVTGTETCDDGDATAGDGCTADCQQEDGWTCPIPGAPCSGDS